MSLGLGIRAARFLSASPGRTALVGAGVGAAAGAMAAPEDQRLSGAFRGALMGGAVGGVGGGLARTYRDTRLIAQAKGQPLSAMGAIPEAGKRVGRELKQFGQRQWYGLTGRGSPTDIRMAGNETSRRRARLLDLRAQDEIAHAPSAEAKQRLRENANNAMKAELEAGRRSQHLQDAGVTSLPGMYRGLRDPTRRSDAFRAMGRTMTDGPGGLTMSVVLPAALSAPELLRGDESAYGGKSMKQKVVGLGANLATGAAFGGMPLIPQMALGTAADVLTQRVLKPRQNPQLMYPYGVPQ